MRTGAVRMEEERTMTKLYLVTGFLGAGKSTFIKNFIRLFAGQKTQLIINDFGREGVDGTLLAELGAELDEIAGGSVFCSCRIDEFERALQRFVKEDSDVVIVEASGLSNPTGVRKLLAQTDRFPGISYEGAICLVDAIRFPKVYATAQNAVKQLASSDIALINKVDKATPAQLAATRDIIVGQRPDIPIAETSFGAIDFDVLDVLAKHQHDDGMEAPMTADLTSRVLYLQLADGVPRATLEHIIETFLDQTYRVKGFVNTVEGVMIVNCVGTYSSIEPFSGAVDADKLNTLVILSGKGMSAYKYVKHAAETYHDEVVGFSR
jgi:G3E family GTPase